MCFLVEITDDVISDAYKLGQTADIYNFDMIEVFIDQDKSGGEHIFDTNTTNAENAFAYHIFAKQPESDPSTTEYYVTDLAGTGWNNRKDPSYVDHLPEFSLGRIDNVSTYEFSLIVYNDTYSESNKETSRVTLQKNTEMGLSLAANDDDEPEIDPSKTERDNMIGSVAVKKENNNDHWMLANDFGTVRLLSDYQSSIANQASAKLKIFPNPAKDVISITNNNNITKVDIFNVYGQHIKVIFPNSNNFKIDINDLQSGMYIFNFELSNSIIQEKVIIH